eukprot:4352100-Amphidinium_carterae.3
MHACHLTQEGRALVPRTGKPSKGKGKSAGVRPDSGTTDRHPDATMDDKVVDVDSEDELPRALKAARAPDSPAGDVDEHECAMLTHQ